MPESPHSPRAFLIVIRQVFPLDQEMISVGRGLDNTLVIDDPSVSRSHVQITATPEGFRVQDLGSTGGTYVNGRQVDQRHLHSGDILSLAGVSILFVEDTPKPLDTSQLRNLNL